MSGITGTCNVCCSCFQEVACSSQEIGGATATDGSINKIKGVWKVINNRYVLTTFHENPGYVRTVDVIDPENPVFLPTTVTINNGPNGCDATDNYLYLPCNTGHLYIVDITDPTALSTVGYSTSFTNSQIFDISVDDNESYAYGANASGKGLLVFDISNKSSPTLTTNISFNAGGVRWRDDNVYITKYNTNELLVYNVSTPASPNLIGSVAGFTFPVPVELHPTEAVAYVGGYNNNNLWAVDISDPTNPTVTANINIAGNGQPHFGSINFQGDFIYLNSLDGYITVIAIHDPASPVVVCSMNTGYNSPMERMLINGDYLYLPDRNAGLDYFKVREQDYNTYYSSKNIIVNGSITSLTQ